MKKQKYILKAGQLGVMRSGEWFTTGYTTSFGHYLTSLRDNSNHIIKEKYDINTLQSKNTSAMDIISLWSINSIESLNKIMSEGEPAALEYGNLNAPVWTTIKQNNEIITNVKSTTPINKQLDNNIKVTTEIEVKINDKIVDMENLTTDQVQILKFFGILN